MDKGLQGIGVEENQMMKEDFEATHDSSAGLENSIALGL